MQRQGQDVSRMSARAEAYRNYDDFVNVNNGDLQACGRLGRVQGRLRPLQSEKHKSTIEVANEVLRTETTDVSERLQRQ